MEYEIAAISATAVFAASAATTTTTATAAAAATAATIATAAISTTAAAAAAAVAVAAAPAAATTAAAALSHVHCFPAFYPRPQCPGPPSLSSHCHAPCPCSQMPKSPESPSLVVTAPRGYRSAPNRGRPWPPSAADALIAAEVSPTTVVSRDICLQWRS